MNHKNPPHLFNKNLSESCKKIENQPDPNPILLAQSFLWTRAQNCGWSKAEHLGSHGSSWEEKNKVIKLSKANI